MINSCFICDEKTVNYVRENHSFDLNVFSQMVEMVCLHVISLMEALQECNSTIFVKVCYNSSIFSTWLIYAHLNM